MPLPTPFHPRTSALCTSYRWKEWAGYYAVCSYDTTHDREYMALRHAAGLLDVSPLYKYSVEGPDAAAFLARVMTRDVKRLQVGQVGYGPWCDGRGKVLDDGTVTRLDESSFRVTSADPSFAWLAQHKGAYRVELEDRSDALAALSLQGPNSRAVLASACDADVSGLRFFRHMRARLAGVAVEITRTGYTGDLGYEIWVQSGNALPVWDALMDCGKPLGLEPMGLDALDVSRVEAGFILLGVDYRSSRRCFAPRQTSSPYEIGLGWAVHLDREPFIGHGALLEESSRGSPWQMVGLVSDYAELEQLYDSYGLPVAIETHARRTPIPVYDGPQQVGYATSAAWSPLLKKDLALASIRTPYASPGRRLRLEHTVEFERRSVSATVVERPFFDPERKRA